MDDKDRVRVDLLKFRRKAYLSYPEGSEERKVFLKIILQNELYNTEKEVPQELCQFIIEGEKIVLKNAIKEFLVGLLIAFSFYAASIMARHAWHGFFTWACVGCALISLFNSGRTLYGYWKYHKSAKVVKQYSNETKQQVSKILEKIKRLEGPRGF